MAEMSGFSYLIISSIVLFQNILDNRDNACTCLDNTTDDNQVYMYEASFFHDSQYNEAIKLKINVQHGLTELLLTS